MARIETLKIFVDVIRTRNFSATGKVLGITPSAVSKQISLLEARLGVRLLHRTTRSVSPTEAGEIYYSRVCQSLEELDEAEAQIADLDSTPKGTLKIAAEPIFGRVILAQIIAAYGEAFPDVDIELFLSDHALELVKKGFDLGLHLGDIQDPSLQATQLANHNVVLCASEEYLQRAGQPETTEDLNKHQLIRISTIEFQQVRQLDDFFDTLGIYQGFHLTVNDIDMAYHAALNGIGIVPLPNYLINAQIEKGRLIQVLPSLRIDSSPVQLVQQKRHYASSKRDSFTQFLLNYLGA